jgi:hypothetical protein
MKEVETDLISENIPEEKIEVMVNNLDDLTKNRKRKKPCRQ